MGNRIRRPMKNPIEKAVITSDWPQYRKLHFHLGGNGVYEDLLQSLVYSL